MIKNTTITQRLHMCYTAITHVLHNNYTPSTQPRYTREIACDKKHDYTCVTPRLHTCYTTTTQKLHNKYTTTLHNSHYTLGTQRTACYTLCYSRCSIAVKYNHHGRQLVRFCGQFVHGIAGRARRHRRDGSTGGSSLKSG